MVAGDAYMPQNYFVLGTDYNTYSAIYSCSDFGFYYLDFVWILSRDISMDSTILEQAYAPFQLNNIKLGYLMEARDGNCTL